MAITNKKSGVWSQNDVVQKINADRWTIYNSANDPTRLEMFGRQTIGEDGLSLPPTDTSSPTQVPGTNWCQVSFGWGVSSGIKNDNTLWIWGNNAKGQLGQSDLVHRSSPVQIPGTNWCQVSVGKELEVTVYAIKTDNTLWAWGANFAGEMGLNDLSNLCYSSPVQIPGASWCKVVTGVDNHLALRTDNTLWTWGRGILGSNGLGGSANASSPTQLPGTWIDMSTQLNGGFAIKTDNTLWAWGLNNFGQLGQSDRVHRSSPVQIPGTTWCRVHSAERSVAALMTDGTLWSWGCNTNGQLGTNNRLSRSSPTQIPGTTWCKVKMDFTRLMSERTDKTLWMSGLDIAMENSELATRSSPVQIPGSCWVDFGSSDSVTGLVRY